MDILSCYIRTAYDKHKNFPKVDKIYSTKENICIGREQYLSCMYFCSGSTVAIPQLPVKFKGVSRISMSSLGIEI